MLDVVQGAGDYATKLGITILNKCFRYHLDTSTAGTYFIEVPFHSSIFLLKNPSTKL
jgi:hypothetical protein